VRRAIPAMAASRLKGESTFSQWYRRITWYRVQGSHLSVSVCRTDLGH